jgi:hypothetical protein
MTDGSAPLQGMSPESLQALADLVRAAGINMAAAKNKSWLSPDYIESIASVIGALAWPSAILTCALFFRTQLGSLIENTESVEIFGTKILRKLQKEVNAAADEAKGKTGPPAPPSEAELARARVVEHLVPITNPDLIRREGEALATEYEHVRASMLPGHARTRQMEIIVSKMRALGRVIFPFRYELTASPSPGKRLLAIASLQVIPDYELVDWLVDRVGVERPFVSYHALVALLVAARAPNAKAYRPLLEEAVEKLRARTSRLSSDTDRISTLKDIEAAVIGLSH